MSYKVLNTVMLTSYSLRLLFIRCYVMFKYLFLYCVLFLSLVFVSACDPLNAKSQKNNVQVGSRPYYLIDKLADGELKDKLKGCSEGEFYKTDFSISHRGAPLQYPEHTKESYIAGARMGAGILECDVTFTKDKELVCRHSQCDLHATTNILTIPSLAAKCTTPFTPADIQKGVNASAQCCTSDITLNEFKMLKGKMDGVNANATTIKEYIAGTPKFRTNLYSNSGTLMTHAESITLFKQLGVKMTPELKAPQVSMPFNGFSQKDFANKMLAEYKQANVSADQVFPQSFNLSDIKHWIKESPEFAKQAVFLDEREISDSFDPTKPATFSPSMDELVKDGVKILAPPIWMLITTNENNHVVPSAYAKEAKRAGLDIIAWTFERSGNYVEGGGWYYQTVNKVIKHDADQLVVLNVLAQQVGVKGVFSDWPGTVSYYASCMSL